MADLMTLKQARDQIHAFATAAVRTDDPRSYYVTMNVLVMDDWWKAIDVELARQSDDVSDEDVQKVLRAAGRGDFHRDDVRAALTAIRSTRPAPDKEDPSARSMASAPRDGTLVRLLVRFTDHALHDNNDPQWTIGQNGRDHTGDDRWEFAGWNWEQDCFAAGEGEPIGWLPMWDEPAQKCAAPAELAAEYTRGRCDGWDAKAAQEKAEPVPSEDQEGLAEKCQRIAQNRDYWFGVAEELRQKLLDAEKTAPPAERDVVSGDSGRPWLPMASAPRDGRVVELRWGEDGIAPGWWTGDVALPTDYKPSDEYLWRFIDARSSESGEYFLNTARDNEYGPTHWRPYAPPRAERAKVLDGMTIVPDRFVETIRAAGRNGVHPRAVPQLIAEALAMLSAAPEADHG